MTGGIPEISDRAPGRGADLSTDLEALVDPVSRPDPYPVLRRLREASAHTAADGLVVVAGHADCSKVLRDPGMSSERDLFRLSPTARGPRTRNFIHLDPPDHTRLRRLVTKAFSPRVVAALEPRIRTLAEDLFRAAAERGRFEVVSDLAYPLPLQVICELLGVPAADRHLFQAWSAKLSEALEPPLPGLVAPRATSEAARARAEFIGYFREVIAERRASPRDDLVSQLIQVNENGDQLTDSELLATCILLINAGHETTVNLITNGVLALLRDLDALRLLRAEPELAGNTVEEVLRYDAPVQLTTRVARQDTAVGDTVARAGDMLLVLIGAANRDPQVFEEPDRFDIRRPRASQHLSFSAGAHFCLGAALARLEVRIAFELFATHVIAPRLTGEEIPYKPNLSLRGPDRLDVEFHDIKLPD